MTTARLKTIPKARPATEASPAEKAGKKRGRGRGKIGREAIIEATRQLLRDVPPSSLTRKSVAEAANIDPALVRYYFSDLRHLLNEVLRLLVDDYRLRYEALDIDPEKPAEAIAKRLRHLVTFLAREPSFHELFNEQIINGKDEWAAQKRDYFTDTFYGSLSMLIDNGRANGQFREDFDPRFVYLAMIGAAQFLATSRTIFNRLFGEDVRPLDQADAYSHFLTETILGSISKQEDRPQGAVDQPARKP